VRLSELDLRRRAWWRRVRPWPPDPGLFGPQVPGRIGLLFPRGRRYVTDALRDNVATHRSWLRDGAPAEMGNPSRSVLEGAIAHHEEWIRRWGLPLARRR